MRPITIFHNPARVTSRKVLAPIRNGGVEPTIADYLKHLPCRKRLVQLLAAMSIRVRELLHDLQRGALNKEDGEPVIDAEDRRVVR